MLIVEDGSGIYEANSYAGLSYAHWYLSTRGRAAEWDAASVAQREAALIAATDYIDRRYGQFFVGQKQFRDIRTSAFNFLQLRSQPQINDTITIGGVVYTFVSASSGPFDIVIGAGVSDTVLAAVLIINDSLIVSADMIGSNSLIVRSRTLGINDVLIETTSSAPTRLAWDYTSLIGASDLTTQTLEWPRAYCYSSSEILGVPEKIRQATVELATRALTSGLMPDPEVSANGQIATRVFEKVGPIETETAYSSSINAIFKKFPEVDRLMASFLIGVGGVIR